MIPKIFSAPGSTLAEPSVYDRVRDAVWMLFMHDEPYRTYYAFDPEEDEPVLRISAGFAHMHGQSFVLPQLVVQSTLENNSTEFNVTADGQERVSIAISHFERPTTARLPFDAEEPPMTPERLIAHDIEILRKGTIHTEGMTTAQGKLVDPYSPLTEAGTYEPDGRRELNSLLPTFRFAKPFVIKRSTKRDDVMKEFADLDAQRDLAVIYSIIATYVIDLQDIENLRHGGYTT